MAIDSFANVFAGNPLERASYRRADEDWLAERLADRNSLALAMWNGKPLVEDAKSGGAQIAYLVRGGCTLAPDAYLFTVIDRAIIAEMSKLPKRQ